ncbi:hypothetical protein [Carboxylicivirga sp. RSCT41]|uniref:hypothetical protein n=1 Tax=Carboxylicivirga agarovorans TaxID=3417570 RepID=UPI003D349EF5
MDEDIYKQLLDKAKKDKPSLDNVGSLKRKVMDRIEPPKKQSLGFLKFVRVAASVVLLFCCGVYTWLEVYTWESRLAIRSSNDPVIYKSDWQCRMTANDLLTKLLETNAMMRHNDDVILNKGSVQLLQIENAELFSFVENLLTQIERYSPVDFQAYHAGEDIRLSAWQLRREYGFCEWMNK